ncbi:MAG: trypsin-like peptidase domain-containing protein [Verrucomicrobiota bacterium JB023]|nr:trypsin-like peptidase domain-containing protein [Verrucomicrobiota bacterium JB023]
MMRWIWAWYLAVAISLPAEVDLRALEAAVIDVTEKAEETIVAIMADELGSTGSGVVVSAAGLVLTAGHVVTDVEGSGAAVEEVTVLFEDGEERRAKVLGVNRQRDMAMLKLIGEGPWAFSAPGNSAVLRPGDWVVALGHPMGYDPLRPAPVRFGRVISKNQDFFFSSDCVLFGGDSGGPLFDLEGRVVGIHSWIGEDVQTNTHAGISGALKDWDDLKAGERWGTLMPPPSLQEGDAVLGVMYDQNQEAVVLDMVLADSPAEDAGLRAGDVILRVDKFRISGANFGTYLRQKRAGDEIVLEVRRGREELFVRVELGAVANLPFVTERGKRVLDEQAGELFTAAGAITAPLGNGVLRIFGDEEQIAYGTVWEGNLVLTKWSVVEKAKNLRGVSSLGEEFSLAVKEIYAGHDLAVLMIPEEVRLQPIPVRVGAREAGEFILAPRPDGVAEALGVISVAERSLLQKDRGFLGVVLDELHQGPGARVQLVQKDSAARQAGMKPGDVVLKVDGREIDGYQELKTILSRAGAGQAVSIEVLRGEQEVSLDAILKGWNLPKMRPGRRERMMDRMDERGLSQVRDGFPRVLQTDMTVLPSEVGLPVVDLNGQLVGVLIARAGRVKTYVIPSSALIELLGKE